MSRGGGDKKSELAKKSGLTKITNLNDDTIDVRKVIAEETGVGQGTVQRYIQLSKQASPELLEKVKTGEMKINTAHRLLIPEVLKQLRYIDKLYDFIEKHVPIIGDDDANREIKKEMDELMKSLNRLRGPKNA